MPRIRPGMKKPPPGFDIINDTLDKFEDEMKLALQEESTGVIGQTTRPHYTSGAKDVAEIKRRRVEEANADDNIAAFTANSQNRAPDGESSEPEQSEEQNHKSVPPLWRIAQINRERTRYVFEAFFRQKAISKEVYDYCCEMQFIDGGLARRWRLAGYEKLCCTACAVPGAASVAASITSKYALRNKQEQRRASDSAQQKGENSSTCICRVPSSQRKSKHFFACTVCGCQGCCSTDVTVARKSPEKQPNTNK